MSSYNYSEDYFLLIWRNAMGKAHTNIFSKVLYPDCSDIINGTARREG
jgi:hypothetical protein